MKNKNSVLMAHFFQYLFFRIILIGLFYYALPVVHSAQVVNGLRNDNILVEGLKPYNTAENISLYYPKRELRHTGTETAFMKNIASVKHPLSMIGKGKPKTEILEALKPNIIFFEKEIANKNLKSKRNRQLYYASALNLAHIYRCLDDFEKAQFYIRLLIAENYLSCMPHTTHIAELKEVFDAQTGINTSAAQQKKALDRFITLKKQYNSVGYIVLQKGNRRIDGTLLNVLENFGDNKVKLKYEKNISTDGPTEYALIDVKEIHFDDWHLAIVPYETSKIYLMEIVYQSPKIGYYKTLPEMGILDPISKKPNEIELLKKGNNSDFKHINDSGLKTYEGNLYRYLKDCRIVARQARYGYYTKRQLLQAVMDYDSVCGFPKNTKPIEDNARQKNNHFVSKGASYDLGINTGSNSFTSLFGLSSNIRMQDKLFARLGVGIGFWGAKFAAGIKYDMRRDMRYSNGWSFATGYSYSTGTQQNLTVNVRKSQTIGATTTTINEKVTIRTLGAGAVNLSLIYNKYLGKKKSIFIELGYAIALQKAPWIVQTAGIQPSKELDSAIKIVQPGGLLIGLGMNFSVK